MTRTRKALAPTLLLSALLATAGCDTGGPEFPDGETILFAATLGDGEVLRHFFSLTHNGSVRIVLTELSATNPETGEPIANPTLVVSLGRPDEGECNARLTRILPQGSSFPVFLEVGQFCLETGRPVGIPQAAPVSYLITIEKVFS